ncbi:MAG TPA: CDP-alcohol phosphatidyltransferase family protein [Polyangia bacterium]|nr:CDP-alcohol phosphatidyltransferase family protein [Polyangia bacterium]
MIERVSPISRATAAVLPGIVGRLAPEAIVPVILLATKQEARGALMRVGGLRVIDRTLRQMARLRDVRVTIVSDGSIRLPKRLPAHVTVRTSENPGAVVTELKTQMDDPIVIGADVVRVQGNRLDRGTRVVDRATRRVAEDAVFEDLMRGDLGLVARVINKKISFRLTRYLLVHLPFTPNMITLVAGCIGLCGAMLISTGTYDNVLMGFLLAQTQSILDGCDGELARVRFQQTGIGEWLDTIVDDFLNVAIVLAVGVALWRKGAPLGDFKDIKVGNVLAALNGGTFLDMKMALAAAGMLLFYNVVAYRELVKQGEGGEVLKIRWWFAYGQSLKSMSGAGAGPLKAILTIGKRDFFIFAWLVLAYFDLLPIVLLYALVLAIVYAGVAVGQLMTPDWRLRPPV